MKSLTLREKIGQKLIIKVSGKEISKETREMIEKYKVGGVILYRKNYDTYDEMLKIINELKKINKESGNIPLFISIDQEGGRVNRMPHELRNIKSAGKLISTQNIELVKEAGAVTAKMLRKSGFNMNYAPVLDIQRFQNNHAIGDRCYGKNAEEVSKYGLQVMQKLSKEGVIPVIKHFPGHGSTTQDSHFFLPVIGKSINELEKDDMLPFEIAIGQGADVLMVGHLVIKDVDSKNPASLSSKMINAYIRGKYQYKGVIMTDDLKMRAISLRYGYVRAAVKACKAKNDIIMIGTPYNTVIRVIKKIEKNVMNNKIDINDIDKSVERIIKLKEKYNVNDEPAKGCDIEEINKRIEKINSNIENWASFAKIEQCTNYTKLQLKSDNRRQKKVA